MKKLMNNPGAIRGLFVFALLIMEWLSYHVPMDEFKQGWTITLVGAITMVGLFFGIIYHEGKTEVEP